MALGPARIQRKQGGTTTLSFGFEVITPVFGGGVFVDGDELKRQQKPIDPVTPVRAPSIRGQLRFWWRAAIGCMQPTLAAMREREAEIWGAASVPGEVALRVVNPDRLQATPLEVFFSDRGGSGRWNSRQLPGMRELAYGAFPLQAKGNQPGPVQPGHLWALEGRFVLELSCPDRIVGEVRSAAQLWLAFGGVGGRTRRGFGAVALDGLLDPGNLLEGLSATPPRSSGVSSIHAARQVISATVFSNGLDALKGGLGALQSFRQGEYLGRNPRSSKPGNRSPAGRSRWPEPDEIRRLSLTVFGTLGVLRSDRTPLGTVAKFPRAAFGMPMRFHFPERGEPQESTLKPVGAERLASPLIIRPFREAPGRFRCLALVLNGSFAPTDPLQLCDDAAKKRAPVSADLTRTEAASIGPLAGNPDVLGAFLDYFRTA